MERDNPAVPAPPDDNTQAQSVPQLDDTVAPSPIDNGVDEAPTGARQHRNIRVMPEGGAPSRPLEQPEETEEVAPLERIPVPATKTHKLRPDLRQEELVKGTHPGDRYVRYRHNTGPFRRKSGGVLSASLEADQPRSSGGRFFNRVKRTLIGAPISTEHSMHERLTNAKALAVLSSDALSSVAYATEEILRILIVGGSVAVAASLPIAFAIIILMIIVVSSYRQTIAAYPRGGGSYIVAKDNLGTLPGLTAAASILIGYILTVAVSVSAGVAALYSIFPAVEPYKVEICVGLVILITIANLRGVREAGNIFAVPTYLFIVGMLALIVYGFMRYFFQFGGPLVYHPPADALSQGAEAVTFVLLLRAFTQGSAALTGVEAIADGVPAFKPPEAKNARTTLALMAVISIVMFGGITFLAAQLGVVPSASETVVSQIARTVFGPNALWFFIQIVTTLILVLAANTAFSDFPRLSYFLARDKFMPHQYAFRGDRLAFSWGIVTLAALACVLIVVYGGDTTALIPLYAVGVFSAFTFSQSGMVVRWWKTRTKGWVGNMLINGLGALTTFLVFAVATITKLEFGTWIVIAVIPIQILIFLAINRHYTHFAGQITPVMPLDPNQFKHTVIVPVSSLNPVVRSALAYARSITPNVTAVHIAEGEDPEEVETFHDQWRTLLPDTDIALVVIESPYRSLIGPLLSYIDALDRQNPDDTITIVVPELLPSRPWEYLLHNQSALRLKAALLFRPNTVVANVPYVTGGARALERARAGARTRAWLGWLVVGVGIAAAALVYARFFVR